jgi:hypothetical protein
LVNIPLGVEDPSKTFSPVTTTISSTTTVYTFSNGATFSPFLVPETAEPGSVGQAIPQPTTPPEMPILDLVNNDNVEGQAQSGESGMILPGPNGSKVTALAKPSSGQSGRGLLINGVHIPNDGEFTLANGMVGRVDSRGFIIIGTRTYIPSYLGSVPTHTAGENDPMRGGLIEDDQLEGTISSIRNKEKKSSSEQNFSFNLVIYLLVLLLLELTFVVFYA